MVLVTSPIVTLTSYTQTPKPFMPPDIVKIPALRVPGPGAVRGLTVRVLLNEPLGTSYSAEISAYA